MFCETKDLSRETLKALGLSFNPFKAIVAPRPVGWISTVNSKGVVNLAPYSFFNAVSSDPPMVFYGANGTHDADGGEKGSLRNVRETGEFVCNLVTQELLHAMNDTATPAPRVAAPTPRARSPSRGWAILTTPWSLKPSSSSARAGRWYATPKQRRRSRPAHAVMPALFKLDIRALDHLAPARLFLQHVGAQLLRRRG
jgi:hypothetical protein